MEVWKELESYGYERHSGGLFASDYWKHPEDDERIVWREDAVEKIRLLKSQLSADSLSEPNTRHRRLNGKEVLEAIVDGIWISEEELPEYNRQRVKERAWKIIEDSGYAFAVEKTGGRDLCRVISDLLCPHFPGSEVVMLSDSSENTGLHVGLKLADGTILSATDNQFSGRRDKGNANIRIAKAAELARQVSEDRRNSRLTPGCHAYRGMVPKAKEEEASDSSPSPRPDFDRRKFSRSVWEAHQQGKISDEQMSEIAERQHEQEQASKTFWRKLFK